VAADTVNQRCRILDVQDTSTGDVKEKDILFLSFVRLKWWWLKLKKQ